jgi:CDP-diacylglycerol--serine O-phosphatidyltransferase
MMAFKKEIPNLFTAGNLIGGILAIIFSLTGKIDLAPYCIFISAFCDFLDGFIARLLKVQSELGKQLDSLADMVTFGVAPGIMVYVMMDHPALITSLNSDFSPRSLELSSELELLKYAAFLLPVFALFRLAKFNLDTRQSDSFIGVPTPAMTLFFAVFPLIIIQSYDGMNMANVSESSFRFQCVQLISNPYFLAISSLIFSLLMVSEIPLFALKFKKFGWKGNEIRWIFLTLAVVMLATLFFWAIPLIIILYVILSLINTQFTKHKKNEI